MNVWPDSYMQGIDADVVRFVWVHPELRYGVEIVLNSGRGDNLERAARKGMSWCLRHVPALAGLHQSDLRLRSVSGYEVAPADIVAGVVYRVEPIEAAAELITAPTTVAT